MPIAMIPTKLAYSSLDNLTLQGMTPGKSVFLIVVPVSRPRHYYNFGKITTIAFRYVKTLISMFDSTKKSITEFYGENCYLMCDGAISGMFIMNGITMQPFQSSYQYNNTIDLSNHADKPVYLVTPSPTDPMRYSYSFGRTTNVRLSNVRQMTNVSDKSKKTIHEFKGDPFYLVCNGVVSSKFTITGITLDSDSYYAVDSITLSGFTPETTVYLVTPSSTGIRYSYSFGATTQIDLIKANTLSCSDGVSPKKPLNTFYGDPFYLMYQGTLTDRFTIRDLFNMTPYKKNYLPTDTIALSGFTPDATIYLVTPNNTDSNRYSYNFGAITTIDLNLVSSLRCNDGISSNQPLSYFYNQPFYLMYKGVLTKEFTITDESSISVQWHTVYQDNMALMKAGLYNLDYVYAYSSRPEDISTDSATDNCNSLPPLKVPPESQSSETTPIVLKINQNELQYNSLTGNLGINNGEYWLNLSDVIRVDSPYFTFSGGDQQPVDVVIPTQISTADNTLTVINYIGDKCNYIATCKILAVIPNFDNYYYYVDIVCERPTYVGTAPNGDPYPGVNETKLYTNGTEDAKNAGVLFETPTTDDGFGFYVLNTTTYLQHPIGGTMYNTIDTLNTNLVFRMQSKPTDGTNLYVGQNINLQWGGLGTSSVDVHVQQHNVTGKCLMLVNVPIEKAPISIPIYQDIYEGNTLIETQLSNVFVNSSNCEFIDPYNPPAKSLQEMNYGDLSSLSKAAYYLPTMIPGGDYMNVNTDGTLSVSFMNGSEPKMTADRCRQPWRLSHYVRSNAGDAGVLKIAYNTAAALVYGAQQDSYYVDQSKPGRLTLNVNIWNLYNSPDGYSGDMVPPLLALIDALEFKAYPLEQVIIDYSNAIKDLSNDLTLDQLISSLTTSTPNPNTEIYPLLDSMGSGGQQLGLAGCGFICTKDFLARENFAIMLKYDAITGWKIYGETSTPPIPYFENEHFYDLIQVYKMAAARGNGFNTADAWGKDGIEPIASDGSKPRASNNYANLILSKAYLTNLRIRDVNVTKEDELSFGPNYQGTQYQDGQNHQCFLFYEENTPKVPGCTYGDARIAAANYGSLPSTIPPYVYTDFPMYGIPDSGWGSLTVEIFSYLGIAYVGMNDYTNFCKWHRTFWHLLFIQNGGNMYTWGDSETDKIPLTDPNNYAQTNTDPTTFWLPSYVSYAVTPRDDPPNENQDAPIDADWVNEVLNAKQLHSFDVFQFPPENYYQSKTVTDCKTTYWANRYNPYRGNKSESSHVQWTTPSYCMGYSPAWVAGGKTNTDGFDDTKINRPIAEALNPMFTNTAGLYTANDGDQNILQAYILASLQWPDAPTLPTSVNASIHQPTCPTVNSGGGPYGYDCDVSDFNANTDIPADHSDKKGVRYAVTHQKTEPNPNPKASGTLYVTDKIGYGITTKNGKDWEFPIRDGERCTTWAYIAKSIQRTIISQRGNGWGSTFGNFTSLKGFPSSDPNGARYETLGHDTSASAGTTKLDYIDLRLYQVCETVTSNGNA